MLCAARLLQAPTGRLLPVVLEAPAVPGSTAAASSTSAVSSWPTHTCRSAPPGPVGLEAAAGRTVKTAAREGLAGLVVGSTAKVGQSRSSHRATQPVFRSIRRASGVQAAPVGHSQTAAPAEPVDRAAA